MGKKRIGITQRVTYIPKINERRDVLDQRWMKFADACNLQLIPLPNLGDQIIEYIESLQLDGVIFSGGNNIGMQLGELIKGLSIAEHDVAYERDHTEYAIYKFCIEKNVPLIGICRGMQFIYSQINAKLVEVDSSVHVAKRHVVKFNCPYFTPLYGSSKEVNSYHRYGIDTHNFPNELKICATYIDQVEAFKHQTREILGIMWHPEREEIFSDADVKLFTAFFHN